MFPYFRPPLHHFADGLNIAEINNLQIKVTGHTQYVNSKINQWGNLHCHFKLVNNNMEKPVRRSGNSHLGAKMAARGID